MKTFNKTFDLNQDNAGDWENSAITFSNWNYYMRGVLQAAAEEYEKKSGQFDHPEDYYDSKCFRLADTAWTWFCEARNNEALLLTRYYDLLKLAELPIATINCGSELCPVIGELFFWDNSLMCRTETSPVQCSVLPDGANIEQFITALYGNPLWSLKFLEY